jgi:DNA polymerase I-like protein with 3'-5' exonuclease and polymerase domains
MSTFLIDARFLLRNTTETFWGANLIVVGGKDNTFCFGFTRDLLRLRKSLHISAGAVAFGSDASTFATEEDIRSAIDLCRKLGLVAIEERKLPVLAILATFAHRFSNVVTDDRRILYFCTETRSIHLTTDPGSIERVTPDWVHHNLGVPVQYVPTYLALTEGHQYGQAGRAGARLAVTAREARRLVELHGALPDIYQNLSAMRSPTLRKKLADNQKLFDQRYRDNTTSRSEPLAEWPDSFAWKLDAEAGASLFRDLGFYSLTRMLSLSDKSTPLPALTNDRTRPSKSHHAVLNCREYIELLERIACSKVCAIDTEADDKDPRTANLFGISFALPQGDAFFVPFCARDMGDLTPNTVQRGLKKLFKEQTKFVGHNLKYDFMLLRRNGIDRPAVCFDTLLAAHECFGDLDFFNLPFLAQKFLGRKIKGYKEVVPKEKTFLELPFDEMKEHACSDAGTALQLYTFLEKQLKDREIDQQFEQRTMPLADALMSLEVEGVSVDRKRLEQLRSRLVGGMVEAKQRVSDSIGSDVELDSQVDISTLMREKLGLREVLGRRVLTQSLLEQLAAKRPLLKLVVEYKRIGKQLKRVESIIKEIRRGRVYPLFSQTRERSGRISSTNPDLFADDGLKQLRDCIGGQPAMWLQDARRSLNLAQKASGDLALKKDRTGPKQLNLFMKSQAIMNELDHDDLLLRVLIGESSYQLSAHFLVDRLTVSSIVHTLETRYQKLFRYIADSKAQGLKRGYVERGGIRRYFEGFGSSSIEKRNTAQVLACRWLLQY